MMKCSNCKKVICIVVTFALFLIGCSNGSSEKEVETNKDEKVVSSSMEAETTTETSNDNTNTYSTKQLYLEKLSDLEDSLNASLKEKYDSGITQQIVEAASEEFEKWDDMINEVWSELKGQLAEEDMDKLTEEQINWIKSRDEKSEAAANEVKGGTMEPLSRVTSLAISTKERCYELVNEYMK